MHIGLFDEPSNKQIVARILRYEGRPHVLADTVVRLVPPSGINETHDLCLDDYKTWKLDNSYIPGEYAAGILSSMFLFHSLSMDSPDSRKQVLVLGAGAGGIDMALHSRKPYVNITGVDIDELVLNIGKKWFGSLESDTHHLIVQDGIAFVENAAAQGRKFDFVAVDACGDEQSFPCPHKAFRSENFLQNVKKILTPTGTLTFNLLGRSQDSGKFYERIKQIFACWFIKFPAVENLVLTCLPNWDPAYGNISRLQSDFEALVRIMKLEYLLNDAILVPWYKKQ